MILSRKHEYSVRNIRCAFAITTQLRWPSGKFNSSDGRVVSASASGAVHLGLIQSRVKPITLILVFTASLLDAQH